MATLIIIIILGASIAIGLYFGKQSRERGNAMLDEGKIMRRNGRFWEEESVFFTVAAPADVLEAVRRTNFAGVAVQPSDGGEGYLFQSRENWVASLVNTERREGKNVFRFAFQQWQLPNGLGLPDYLNSMNMLLTAVEKLFFSLDAGTTVERHKIQIKTKSKTSFF